MRRSGYWRPNREGGSRWVEVRRYRLMCFREPLAPWRASKAEAEADALEQRVASRYRNQRFIFLTVPAWILECDPNEETEAGLEYRSTRRLIEVADTSQLGRARHWRHGR